MTYFLSNLIFRDKLSNLAAIAYLYLYLKPKNILTISEQKVIIFEANKYMQAFFYCLNNPIFKKPINLTYLYSLSLLMIKSKLNYNYIFYR